MIIFQINSFDFRKDKRMRIKLAKKKETTLNKLFEVYKDR